MALMGRRSSGKKKSIVSDNPDGSTHPAPHFHPYYSPATTCSQNSFGFARKQPTSGREKFDHFLDVWERNTAKELGNLFRLQKSREVDFYRPARAELDRAWSLFLAKYGLDSLFRIRASEQTDMTDMKAFVLAMLRQSDRPETILIRQLPTILSAARANDLEFFRQMKLAQRGQTRAKRSRSFLAFNILRYWFAGLLWLMNDFKGANALRAYTGENIREDAYRKSRQRLRLQGWRKRTCSPPVEAYHPRTKTYAFSSAWTWIDQICPSD